MPARKMITVEFSEAQYLALMAAVDDHEQNLIDNSHGYAAGVELRALQAVRSKIVGAWES